MSAGSADKLVYMANQIAGFFASQRGEDTRALKVADHLNAFWEPAMRRRILEHLEGGGEGLSPLAADAVRLLRSKSSSGVERALHRAGQHSPGHDPGDDAG